MMRSKYNGFCIVCKMPIKIGDEIEKDEQLGKWVHVVHPGDNPFDALIPKAKSELSGRNVPQAIEDVSASVPMETNWIPSVYQQDIFSFITDGQGNAVVEAVAGSGKTSTIIKALELIPSNESVAFLAFNKHIAKELQNRVRAKGLTNVYASTIHSLGFSIVKKLTEYREVDKYKVETIMDGFYPIDKDSVPELSDRIKNKMKRALLRKVVALAKATLVDSQDGDAVLAMIERYGLDADTNGDTPEIIEVLPKVLDKCLANSEQIDYDDMIWLPIVHERLQNHFDKFQWLFIDEAQDLNNSQIEFIKRSVYPYSRTICVGDRNQSLYGFRGADTDAIPRLIRELGARVLPLSITYRCPKSHVALAKGLVPQIEASETAPAGEVHNIEYDKFLQVIDEGDMVVCRTNAPLMKPAFQCIRSGKKAIIRGQDIGEALVKFIEKFQAENLGQLEILMNEYTEQEYNKLIDKGKELQAELVKDRTETIRVVANECKTVIELTNKLEMLYSDSNSGVVFSSVHRAKGLEANRIFILHRELMPHPKAKQDWEKVQETNTLYVALTRSKKELYFVEGE